MKGLERLTGQYYGTLAWVYWYDLEEVQITADTTERTIRNWKRSEDGENYDDIDLLIRKKNSLSLPSNLPGIPLSLPDDTSLVK